MGEAEKRSAYVQSPAGGWKLENYKKKKKSKTRINRAEEENNYEGTGSPLQRNDRTSGRSCQFGHNVRGR